MVRILLIGCMSLTLWISALASPFVFAHILELKGVAAQAGMFAAAGGSVLVLIGFLCYLMDRV
jgi:hypothetical protein